MDGSIRLASAIGARGIDGLLAVLQALVGVRFARRLVIHGAAGLG